MEGFEFDADKMAEMNKNVKKEVAKEKDNVVIDIQCEFDDNNTKEGKEVAHTGNVGSNEMCD